MPGTTLERLLRRDRLLIGGALAALTVLAWLQMFLPGACPLTASGESASAASAASAGHALSPCCAARFGVAFPMWVVMMAGMMIPSVTPMVLTHAAIARRRAAGG